MPYVYANVKVKYGQLPAFYEQMVTIKRVMEEHGWKLVGAWSTLIGDIHEVHDLWEVQDANTVPNGFAAAFEHPGRQDSVQPLTGAGLSSSPRRWRDAHAGAPPRRR